jgi:hypothetical protein
MITLVTGLWDIGRGNLNEGWNRSFDYYLEKFKELLQIDCNLIIFGDNNLEEFVFKYRNPSNTKFINRDLSWFRNNEYFDKIQKIRTNENWYNISGWLKESTQARLEYYNPLVMSKMFLLHDASILDPFNSEKLYWIDAGLTNTVNLGYFTRDNVLDKIESLFDKFMFVVFPYEAENEVHGFDYKKMCDYAKTKTEFVSRGGFFGGTKQKIADLNVLYYQLLIDTLNKNLMGTEESIFTIMTYLYPSMIDYCEIESNGLVYKFFEDVKNNTVLIKNKKNKIIKSNTNSNGIGLYVISFNSPSQFESLIKSMLFYDPNFINGTKKFLLNNSTDLNTTPKYNELCLRYGFDHIKKDNIGITGGRQFIAEHFNKEEDLGYYFFFEDDMEFVNKNSGICKNGFNRYVENLFSKTLNILKTEEFDFLKMNFTEFFGSHQTQWSWYNVPQEFRQNHWPEKPNLPVQGYDPEAPCLEFKNIKSYEGVPYASGQIYLSNWPILMSKEGNYKCYLKNRFDFPYEQTLMSYNFQETVKGNLKPGLLLITPTEHNRFDFYNAELRKEC